MSSPAKKVKRDGLESDEFIEGAKDQMRQHVEMFREGYFNDPEVLKAYCGNKPVLLFIVMLMDKDDPELIQILIDLLCEISNYGKCVDALLRTYQFPAAFAKLRESARARAPDCKDKTRRVHKAFRRRGLGLGLDETPTIDTSNYKFERTKEGHMMMTPPPVGTPVKFINTGNKSRQVTLKIDGIVDQTDREDIKRILVEVLGVVSIYFDSMHEDRVNVRIRQGTNPDMLAKALTTKGPYNVYLVVKTTSGGEALENLVLLGSGTSGDESYLPDQTVVDHEDKAPVPVSDGASGGSSWSIFSTVKNFIRRPFW